MNEATVFNGLELLIRLIDTSAAASARIKAARAEGRDVTPAEVSDVLGGLRSDLAALDAAIAGQTAAR